MARKLQIPVVAQECIDALKSSKRIVTDLQLYGPICCKNYFYEKVMKSEYAPTIHLLLRKNRSKASRTATDCLYDKTEEGNIKAAETLGRIVDRDILKSLAPTATLDEEVIENTSDDVKEIKKEISKLIKETGLE